VGRYVAKRILLMVPSLFGVTVAVFVIMNLVPGDVVMARIAEAGSFEQEDVDRLRQELGLDRPMYQRYGSWLWGAVRGDLGDSLWTGTPVTKEIMSRLPITMEIALLAFTTSLLVALGVGVVSAIRQDSTIDYAARVVTIGGLSIPDFWLGTMLIVFPVVWWGYMPPLGYTPFFESPWDNLRQFAPPAIAIGVRSAAGTARLTRSSLLEVLRQDYIRTAWSKGLTERMVVYRHAMKNALIPVVTVLGSQISRLLGGTVIIETVFGLPGVGRLVIESITNRDYIQLQGVVAFLASVFLIVNLLVDLSYSVLDPRIRYQ
jgi:peptide/nickel transport system permease protein